MKIQGSRRRTLQTASVSYFVKFHAVTKYVGDVVVKFKGGTLLESGEIHRQENIINSIMIEMILLKLQHLSKKKLGLLKFDLPRGNSGVARNFKRGRGGMDCKSYQKSGIFQSLGNI